MPDQWEFYPSSVDGEPASIYVDLSYRSAAPIEGHFVLSWLRVHFLQPRDDGLSSQEEFQRLCEIEDAMTEALEDCDAMNYYVGRNTSGGCRDFYIYSANGQLIETILSQSMVPFPEYDFETGHRSDQDWAAYLEFLCPSHRDFHLIRNQHVIVTLKESNDLLEVPREVAHWAYFSTCKERDNYVFNAKKTGFALQRNIEPDEENEQFGAVLTRVDPVDYWSINDVCLLLFDLAEEAGGKYDGWETPVVTEADRQDSY